jgi:hypothetical protein
VLPLAFKYLESPGKERDAAKALLVRVAMRRDMQELGVLTALVQWALYTLRTQQHDPAPQPYYCIGVLSFLAGILNASSDTSDMTKYLASIFQATLQPARSDDQQSSTGGITSSAMARKAMIKVLRSVAVLVLRYRRQEMGGIELIETTIGYFLDCLADNDTPVRFAASKALSVIALKLDPDMASQVVEAALEALNKNVFWTKRATAESATTVRDLSAVNALEWHGLMLTLSHLLYRRSPPAEDLSSIIRALLMGLGFEQRSTSGVSVGTNVRDAACFGIWALARRYTTTELLAVPVDDISTADSSTSILQVLATELMVTASLDPAGNIRRGSSAALQELIGRHPDTIEKGISVVQTVDYHAVALRTRAIREVAVGATRLAARYGHALLQALLTWRGIGSPDEPARRVAATAFGLIAAELASSAADPVLHLSGSVVVILKRLRRLELRQVDERHGLLLALAALLDQVPAQSTLPVSSTVELARTVVRALEEILTDCRDKTYRRPELVADGAARLVVSSFPLLQAAVLARDSTPHLVSGPAFVSSAGTDSFKQTVAMLDGADGIRIQAVLTLLGANLAEWLKRQDPTASEAALIYLVLSNTQTREDTIAAWAEMVRRLPGSRSAAGTGRGHAAALTTAYGTVSTIRGRESKLTSLICEAIIERWSSDKTIETRVGLLQSLTGSELLIRNTAEFTKVIVEGLDNYTTDARGDIGSHVRLQAIRATKSLWQAPPGSQDSTSSQLFLKILRLAAEKLDRVRVEAQATLAVAMSPQSVPHRNWLM